MKQEGFARGVGRGSPSRVAEEGADRRLRLEERIAELEDALFDVALVADGHRWSTAYDEAGMNIALCVILARAAASLGRTGELRERGTLLASVDIPSAKA